MAEPRSGIYSKLQSSTGKKSDNSGIDFCAFSTSVRLKGGKPENLPGFTFCLLKFTLGPKSYSD